MGTELRRNQKNCRMINSHHCRDLSQRYLVSRYDSYNCQAEQVLFKKNMCTLNIENTKLRNK